ncbi:hypothetical protein PR002_g12973 [Phytophthora rubi]|uniref:Uncharacterized protein n=1 Tax=Phytophthora rubi TaxID=129364 RepID=A0A6A3LLC2_9STRA|nr:hypothetical protein PR002_g12973 [Phytophthora rubi]
MPVADEASGQHPAQAARRQEQPRHEVEVECDKGGDAVHLLARPTAPAALLDLLASSGSESDDADVVLTSSRKAADGHEPIEVHEAGAHLTRSEVPTKTAFTSLVLVKSLMAAKALALMKLLGPTKPLGALKLLDVVKLPSPMKLQSPVTLLGPVKLLSPGKLLSFVKPLVVVRFLLVMKVVLTLAFPSAVEFPSAMMFLSTKKFLETMTAPLLPLTAIMSR